jgi:WD40 repeat protein
MLLSEWRIPSDATVELPSPIRPAVLTFGTDSSNHNNNNNSSTTHDPTRSGNTTVIEISTVSIQHHTGLDDDQTTNNHNSNNNHKKNSKFLIVGRQPSTCDIRIGHKSLSRQHAILYYRPTKRYPNNNNNNLTTSNKYADDDNTHVGTRQQHQEQLDLNHERWELYIQDLDTKSGTYVNEQRIDKKEQVFILQQGDRIQFGKAPTIFTVQWPRRFHNLDDTVSVKDEGNNNNESQDGSEAVSEDSIIHNDTTTAPTVNTTVDDDSAEQQPLLSGRAQRQAEIAAMMASLDVVPTYTKHVLLPNNEEKYTQSSNKQQFLQATSSSSSSAGIQSITTTTTTTTTTLTTIPPSMVQKYKLPLTESTMMAPIHDSTDDEYQHQQHKNTISCIGMDPTGARFAIGGMDSSLKLYDFGGYTTTTEGQPVPFQNVIVQDGYPVRCIAYSPTGEKVVIGTGSAQPMVLTRDGEELIQCVRGDVYVTDPSKTIGHTATVTCVGWHPTNKSIIFTTSRDGSVRSWNVDKGKLSFGMLTCTDVVVIKNLLTGRKTIPTCLTISTSHTSIQLAVGTECGSIQIYNHPYISKLRPQQSVQVTNSNSGSSNGMKDTRGGQLSSSPIISVLYSSDGMKLASRTEHTVHVWDTADTRKLSKSSTPYMVCSMINNTDIDNTNHDNNIKRDTNKGQSPPQQQHDTIAVVDADNCTPTMAFSPNGKILCVAVTPRKRMATKMSNKIQEEWKYQSMIQIYVLPPVATMEPTHPIYVLPLTGSGSVNGSGPTSSILDKYPICGLVWHTKLNQLLVSTNGGFQIYYSTDWSKKGILLTESRIRSSSNKNDIEMDLQELYATKNSQSALGGNSSLSYIREEDIITPNALPLFGGTDRSKKNNKKRKLNQSGNDKDELDDDTMHHIPQKPPSRGVYETQNTMFTQLIMDTNTSAKKRIAGMDPREALALYSEGRSFIGKAYEGNIERILTEKTVEQEEDEMKKKR